MATVSISPDFNLHHHDNNGNPASGWLVYTFESRTENLKESYSEPTGSIKHRNPIVLDSRGEYPGEGLYLISGEAYTLELRTPADVPVRTANSVFGGGSGSGGTSTVVLPPHTAYANELESTYDAHPVEIVETLVGKDASLIVSVGAVQEGLDTKLGNTGNQSLEGTLAVSQSITTETLNVNEIILSGTNINEVFVPIANHGARTLVGNKDTTVGDVEDIAIANDLSSNSADVIPSVVAVVNGIATAISNIPNPDSYTVKTSVTDTSPDYLFNKVQAGAGISITNEGELVTISASSSTEPPDSFNSNSYSSILWNKVMPSTPGNFAPYKYWWSAASGDQLEDNVVTCTEWDNTNLVFTAITAGRWQFSASRSGSIANPSPSQVAQYCLVRRYGSGSADIYPVGNSGSVTVVLDVEPGEQVYFAKCSEFNVLENTYSTYTFTGHSMAIGSGASQYNRTRVVYVSNQGSDNNSGRTPSSPKLTIDNAQTTAKSAQMEEGLNEFWTVVCEDASTFAMTTGATQVPPFINLYAPLATMVYNSTLQASFCEGSTYTAKKVIAQQLYSYSGVASVLLNPTISTTVNIEEFIMAGRGSYALISTTSTNTGEYFTGPDVTTFNIGTIYADYREGLVPLTGLLGNVSAGSAQKIVNFNVGSIRIDADSDPSNFYGCVVWDNANGSTVNAKLGEVVAPRFYLTSRVSQGITNVDVMDATVNGIVYDVGINSTIGVNGGRITANEYGYLRNAGNKVTIDANVDCDTAFDETGYEGVTVINLSAPGKVTVRGSDFPGHLKDKIVAGTNVTITESGDTLVIASTGGSGSVTGTGTALHHTLWTDTTVLGDSVIKEDSRGNRYVNTDDSVLLGGINITNNDLKNATGSYLSGSASQNTIDGTGNQLTGNNYNNTVKGTANYLTNGSSENTVIGDENLIDNAVNESYVVGKSNRLRDSASQNFVIGNDNDINTPNNTVVGFTNYQSGTGSKTTMIGNDNRVESPESQAFGTDNYNSGTNAGDSKMIGHANRVVGNSGGSIAIGNTNEISDVSGALVVGKDITIFGTDTIDANGAHFGIGSHGNLHLHGRLVGNNNVYATTGKTIGFDSNGEMTVVDSASEPSTKSESTGLLTMVGGITVGDATHVLIPAFTGQIVSTTGVVTNVTYAGGNVLDIYVSTYPNTHFMCDNTGAISQHSTNSDPIMYRDMIYLGYSVHQPVGTITAFVNSPDIAINEMSQTRDMLNAIGIVNKGVIPSANDVNLLLNTSAGVLYHTGIGWANSHSQPSQVTIASHTPAGIQYRTQTGNSGVSTTSLEVGYYDVAGTRTALSGTKYTTQRIYISPSGAIRLQYGQVQYTSMSTALAGIASEAYTVYAPFANNFILIGLVTVRSTATDMTNATQCVFTTVSKFGEISSASSGSSTTTLQGAYNNSTSPEIITDASRGALSIQNGVSTATDVDNMLEIQNYLGVVKANITAQGTAFVQALHNAGRLHDGADAYGASGQILSSTGTATQWIDNKVGTVTSVAGTAGQVNVATGTTTPVVSLVLPTSGAQWSSVGVIGSAGVMEVGKYLDFHTANAGTTDYDLRLTANATGASLLLVGGTDKQIVVTDDTRLIQTFTTTGSGAASFSGGTLNIPTPSSSTGDHKVQVSATDTTYDYLYNLLYAGSGISITNPTAGHVLITASGTGAGATTGLETFPIALATSTLGSPSGNSGFLESVFVPSSTVTITKMGVYCTQTASNYEMRIGVYTLGANDALVAQTVRISDVTGNPHLAIGLCIFSLVTPYTMIAGTAYGFAYMCSGQPQYFYVGTGVSGNAPAHTGRADNNPNYGTPVTTMITTASMSPGTIRPWIGAFV